MSKGSLLSRLKRSWSVFRGREETLVSYDSGPSSSYRLDKPDLFRYGDKSIVSTVYNRIALDAASVEIVHAQLDENDRYAETIKSGLNRIFNEDANLDQSGIAFKSELYETLCTQGVIALVPTYADEPIARPWTGDVTPGIYKMRVGRILQWYAKDVLVSVYDEDSGLRKEIKLPKANVGIVENPFYSIMNPINSTAARLTKKLQLLDYIDKQIGSGKLDLIIQLPYGLKSSLQRAQAEERRTQIEDQLHNTKYGIAYIDGTEKIVQLNRPIENNLLSQVEYMTKSFYTQLGVTEEIMNGTAPESAMLNYYNRVIEPLVQAVAAEIQRTYLTLAERNDGQAILYFRDPFKLVPVTQVADIADRLTRNEIATKNEIRSIIGWKPSADPRADQLLNANINHPNEQRYEDIEEEPVPTYGTNQMP